MAVAASRPETTPPLGEPHGSPEPVPRHGSNPTDDSPSSPPADGSDGEDNLLYGDQDDAQCIIQPAMSSVATRLTSPKTPAAEKAAALDNLPGGGLFDVIAEGVELDFAGAAQSSKTSLSSTTSAAAAASRAITHESSSPPLPGRERGMTLGVLPPPSHPARRSDMPSPWQSGPKELVVDAPAATSKSAMAGVFGVQPRTQRASSMGDNALRRLSKAIDSISIPTGLLPNISTPSFLSSHSHKGDPPPLSSTASSPPPIPTRSPYRQSMPLPPVGYVPPREPPSGPPAALRLAGPPRPVSVNSRRSSKLRRTNSDDSVLYHSLSRVSSFGDDERFAHVREQINSRFKAIKDSWDPTFKLPQLPQLPNILPAQLRKPLSQSSESSTDMPRLDPMHATARLPREGLSPLDAALENLTGDVVVMGGYRGSILRSSQPPFRRLWVPVKVGLNIRKVDLELGLEPEADETAEDHIFASGMLQNMGPVDISKRLFRKLRECENARKGKLRVHDYGYDWRLSPHVLSRKLVQFLETLPSNHPSTPSERRGALVISHSLGGVITRHVVNQRPELFAGVVYAGAPQRCINILGPVRNGDAVMLNEKILTAQVNFSLRTTFVFLPEDGYCFVNKYTKEEYRVDLYNVDNWIKYRLSPCVGEPALPLPKSGSLSSLLNLPDLGLRSRSNSNSRNANGSEQSFLSSMEGVRRVTNDFVAFKDRTLAPQMATPTSLPQHQHQQPQHASLNGRLLPGQERNLEYLTRTLAATKRFRAEMAHNPAHQAANVYPPLAVIYGKDIPTTAGAKVASHEAIPTTEAYDELFFGNGDGVVLAKEAMLPPGYELVKGGRISTDRGHITLLGDLQAVGRAIDAVIRGRRKGIGLGESAGGENMMNDVYNGSRSSVAL